MTGVEANAPISHANDISSSADGKYYSSRGFDRPVGRGGAGWLSRLTYFWVNPLLQKGVECGIKEDTAEAFVDPPNRGYLQAEQFAAAYENMQVWPLTVLQPHLHIQCTCFLSLRMDLQAMAGTCAPQQRGILIYDTSRLGLNVPKRACLSGRARAYLSSDLLCSVKRGSESSRGREICSAGLW